MTKAILYSFRRCPYAMRARLAIAISNIQVELREVVLRDKPQALIDISAKATVPVLMTKDNHVIDESINIMLWALQQSDPDGWLTALNEQQKSISTAIITNNDGEFKHYLDRYKYADRFPEHSSQYYRQQAEKTLLDLEQRLVSHRYLLSDNISIADMAVLPFIRQFALVDKVWFDASPYPQLQQWLTNFMSSDLFSRIMPKYPQWQADDDVPLFPLD